MLTAHSECAGYNAAVGETASVRQRQIDDLKTTARQLAVAAPELTVDAYYIELDTGEVLPIESS